VKAAHARRLGAGAGVAADDHQGRRPLERHGFVERIRDEHDRRVWRVKATTRQAPTRAQPHRRTEWLANQLRGVTDEDRAQIMARSTSSSSSPQYPREAP
jgi:hypothetical protein